MLKKLTQHLRSNKHKFIRTIEMCYTEYDPTYGSHIGIMYHKDVDIVDFDALLDAIDAFSEEFA
jgi:hypothetical protein